MDEQVEEIIMEVDEPSFISTIYYGVTDAFVYYGWYILILCGALLYAYYKAQPQIKRYLKKREDEEYAAKYHKNPDLVEARLNAVETARLKMQQQYAKDAEVYQLKMTLKEEKKREEWLQRQCNNSSSGQKLSDSNAASSSSESKSLKPEYNPLMGGGGGSSYKAPKRSACSKGGCGK